MMTMRMVMMMAMAGMMMILRWVGKGHPNSLGSQKRCRVGSRFGAGTWRSPVIAMLMFNGVVHAAHDIYLGGPLRIPLLGRSI